jgi:hypothetical protein
MTTVERCNDDIDEIELSFDGIECVWHFAVVVHDQDIVVAYVAFLAQALAIGCMGWHQCCSMEDNLHFCETGKYKLILWNQTITPAFKM